MKKKFEALLGLLAVIGAIFYKFWPVLLPIIIIGIMIYYLNRSRKKREEEELNRSLTLANIDYMDGLDFEHYISKILNSKGYRAEVTRASNDYGVDIVAIDKDDKYSIQVKRYNTNVSRRAVSDAVAGKSIYNCNKAMVITNSYFSNGAIELAKSTSCILIDRDQLSKWIKQYQEESNID